VELLDLAAVELYVHGALEEHVHLGGGVAGLEDALARRDTPGVGRVLEDRQHVHPLTHLSVTDSMSHAARADERACRGRGVPRPAPAARHRRPPGWRRRAGVADGLCAAPAAARPAPLALGLA